MVLVRERTLYKGTVYKDLTRFFAHEDSWNGTVQP